MKKVLQILTAAILSVSFISVGASAQTALGNCTSIVITNTGPNSNNSGVCTVNTVVTAVCDNNVFVLNSNQQSAVSGAASAAGNTNAGAAISGGSANYNGTTVQLGATGCATTTTTTTTPTPTTTPTTTPVAVKPATLPNTAGTDTMTVVLVSLAAAAGIVALSRFAVAAYNRFGNK